jgi:ankyrin repeat protein
VFEELPRGRTLLHCLRDEQEALVRPLLALGLPVDGADADGRTPAHAAAAGGHAAVLRMLIMCNADPRAHDARGQDALLCAVRSRRNTMVRPRAGCRRARQATIAHRMRTGVVRCVSIVHQQVLHLISAWQQRLSLSRIACALTLRARRVQAVVRTLMKFGVRADVADASGRTALAVAAKRAPPSGCDPLVAYMARASRLQARCRRRETLRASVRLHGA